MLDQPESSLPFHTGTQANTPGQAAPDVTWRLHQTSTHPGLQAPLFLRICRLYPSSSCLPGSAWPGPARLLSRCWVGLLTRLLFLRLFMNFAACPQTGIIALYLPTSHRQAFWNPHSGGRLLVICQSLLQHLLPIGMGGRGVKSPAVEAPLRHFRTFESV